MARRTQVWVATLLLATPAVSAASLDLYEWSAVAPLVVSAQVVGESGRYVEVRVERALRGPLTSGSVVAVDLRTANRLRSMDVDPHALRLEPGRSYVLLLEGRSLDKGRAAYSLVRGVRGSLELPAEGDAVTLATLERVIAIQELHDEQLKWQQMTALLQDTNWLTLQTALDQFLKFRRGSAELLPVLAVLLDHPRPELRRRTALLAADVLRAAAGSDEGEERAKLRSALVARARRDEAVPVRVAATQALAGFVDDAADTVLREIATQDPEQEVRYAAVCILHDRAGAGAAPGAAAPR